MRIINNKLAISRKKQFYLRQKKRFRYIPFEVARGIAYEKGLSNQDLEGYLESTGPTWIDSLWHGER